MPDFKLAAHVEDGAEGFDGEIHTAVDVPQIGQLNPQRLVHWCEVDESVGIDVVLI